MPTKPLSKVPTIQAFNGENFFLKKILSETMVPSDTESDCRLRGHKFDPGLVSYFRGD